MVDLAPADLFSNLRSINLDHNNLTSFSGLIFLPNIKVHNLGQNVNTTLMSVYTYVHYVPLCTYVCFCLCMWSCRYCLWTIITLSQFYHIIKFRVPWATSRFSIIKSVPVDMGSRTAGPAGAHTHTHTHTHIHAGTLNITLS